MKYQFIETHRSRHAVERMCRLLFISRSGFYRWSRGKECKRTAENRTLLENIRKVYKTANGIYGSPRITAELLDQGYRCSRPRVARLMKQHSIRAKTVKKFKVTTNARHKHAIAPNLLNQDFHVAAPNQVWVSDLTYIRTMEGWLYLTVVMDLFHRKIIGWSMSNTMLVHDTTVPAFKMAVQGTKTSTGLVFHSDRGIQYACDQFATLLKQSGVIQSMSGRGNCYDNAVAESFFHTLKTELVNHELYRTRNEARRSIFEYLESFYNRSRRHSTLGYKSPIEYEKMNYNQAI